MKKFTLSLVFAVVFTGGLFAQRTVDMQTTLNSPTDNQELKNGAAFAVNFTLTNNGPDIIKTTDTLAYFLILNNQVSGNQTLYNLKADLAVDSSVTYNFNYATGLSGGPSGELDICAGNVLVNRGGVDTVKDNVLGGNNVSCATVNYKNTASVQSEITTSTLNAYPNPAKNDVTVTFEASTSTAFTINIMDINGKLVQSTNGTSTNGTNNVNMNISELPAGVYMYQLNLDNTTSTNKLIITK